MAAVRDDAEAAAVVKPTAESDAPPRLSAGAAVKEVIALAIPESITFSLQWVVSLVTLSAVGHSADSQHLAGVGLALTIINITMWGAVSVLGAMETLVPQAVGNSNMRMVGWLLQRGVLIGTVLTLAVAGMWLPMRQILMAVGLEHSAADAHSFLMWSLPGVWPFMAYGALLRYLAGQEIVWPPVFALVVSNALHVPLSYVAVSGAFGWGGWGFTGAAIALSATRWLWLATLLVATLVRGDHRATWHGWSWARASDWSGIKQFMKLGIPAGLMIVLETVGYEALTIMAGYLGPHSLAAMSVVSNVYLEFWSIFLGFNVAASILVGQYLGASDPVNAARSAHATLALTFALAAGTGATMFFASRYIVEGLADNEDVRTLADHALRVAAWVCSVDVLQATMCGVMIGIGTPWWGAGANLLGYYAVSIPVAYLIAFRHHDGLQGLWWGLLCGVATVGAVLGLRIACTNWKNRSAVAVAETAQSDRSVSRHHASIETDTTACDSVDTRETAAATSSGPMPTINAARVMTGGRRSISTHAVPT